MMRYRFLTSHWTGGMPAGTGSVRHPFSPAGASLAWPRAVRSMAASAFSTAPA